MKGGEGVRRGDLYMYICDDIYKKLEGFEGRDRMSGGYLLS